MTKSSRVSPRFSFRHSESIFCETETAPRSQQSKQVVENTILHELRRHREIIGWRNYFRVGDQLGAKRSMLATYESCHAVNRLFLSAQPSLLNVLTACEILKHLRGV
jgi:hypothetical protein